MAWERPFEEQDAFRRGYLFPWMSLALFGGEVGTALVHFMDMEMGRMDD